MKELCKPGPGKCWSGEQGKEKGKPMVSLKFSLKKKKKEEDVVPETQPKQLHMNVRDLEIIQGMLNLL